MKFVTQSLQDADVILYLVECGETHYDADIMQQLQKIDIPIILVINKIDRCTSEQVAESEVFWKKILPQAEMVLISALQSQNIDQLLEKITEKLPVHEPYFPKDQLTDRPMRFFVSEIIREKILLYYDKEIPYSVEVRCEAFKETDKQIRISAVIYVERDSQKGIIIGHQGVAIKKVNTEARKALEKFFDKHVFLETFVKVDKDWRSNQKELDSFGYNPE